MCRSSIRRSHASQSTDEFLARLPTQDVIIVGGYHELMEEARRAGDLDVPPSRVVGVKPHQPDQFVAVTTKVLAFDPTDVDVLTRAYVDAYVQIPPLVRFFQKYLPGFERSYHGRPAGFRTHTLVCVASSALMLVTMYQSHWYPESFSGRVALDPTRMAQGIMTGIGFLGAGVIFKEGLTVRGLTTAASIWITAAIGILAGMPIMAV